MIIAVVGGRGDGFTRVLRGLRCVLEEAGHEVGVLAMPQSTGGVGRKRPDSYSWDADVVIATTDRCSACDVALVLSKHGSCTNAPEAVFDSDNPTFSGFKPPEGWLPVPCRRVASEARAPVIPGLVLLGALCALKDLCSPNDIEEGLVEAEGPVGAVSARAALAGWEYVRDRT